MLPRPLALLLLPLALAAPLSSLSCTDDTGDDDGLGDPIPFDLACDGPEAITQPLGSAPSGLVRCADDFVHRTDAVACERPRMGSCVTDDGCDGDGRCVDDPGGGRSCAYGCETDADCQVGQACLCADLPGSEAQPRCIPAGCATDADCGGGLCGLSTRYDCAGTFQQLDCLTEASECRAACSEIRCDDGSRGTPPCGISSQGWSCLDGLACDALNCG